MFLDSMILISYILICCFSKAHYRSVGLIVTIWFAASFFIASLGLKAALVFPVLWAISVISVIKLVNKQAVIVVVPMIAMMILLALMSLDAHLTDEVTPLYSNYSLLALIINIVIMITTFLHGRGLESVTDDLHIDNRHNGKSN